MDAGRTDAGHGADTERGGGARGSEPDDRNAGEAALRDGARPVGECTARGFQDIHDSATSRMPGTGVQDRPTHTCPDAPAPEFRAGVDVDLTV
ncbi:hypothetical protein ACFW5I_08250 [Streptomyces sp. NPDC058818]|uniref:hypothetical protein n=1 Tax=Streptomyces sp. NPDC058818 TaxID=3346640 RepID=UPI0036A5C89F